MKISILGVRQCVAAISILLLTASFAFAGGTVSKYRNLTGQAAILKNYTDGVNLLASDNLQGALTSFKSFEMALMADGRLPFEAEKKTILTQLAQLTAEKDIFQVRKALAPLSISVIQLSQKAGFGDKGVTYFYCPMVGNYWANSSREISNPYAGTSMCHTCGEKVAGL